MANVNKKNINRKFVSFPEDYPIRSKLRPTSLTKKHEDVTKLIKYIDDNIIGRNNPFFGPFGRRKVVFCDYAASGRSLHFIEEYIHKEVLPCHGNTHSTTSITSLQSALYRQEARDIIRSAVNAGDQDLVLFVGHGVPAALHKVIGAMGFQEAPIIFVGPSEHHSNISPWREIGAKIVKISETKEGFLNLNDLENQLQAYQNSGRQLIGCFSSASNITGVLSDDIASTVLLHQYGALSFWDYTSAAPSITMDMNPELPVGGAAFKDAIFFAGHKFIGGVQTPGILVAKRALFKNSISESINRTGFYSKDSTKNVQDLELLEEGCGTAVVESIRAGLCIQLKETVGVSAIMQRNEKITKQMMAHIRTIPEVILLGNGLHSMRRIPIFSFMVRHPRGTFLHHNFVCAVLNDVFGIQARSGCGCAGPYAEDVLGISTDLASKYENILLENMRLDRLQLKRCDECSNHELLRPGFTRISLPYFMSDTEVAFVMEALKMVATEGWKLLPQYVMIPETGEWRHHTNSLCKDRKWLNNIRYIDGKMTLNERKISGPGVFPQTYQDCLQTARNLFNRSRKAAQRNPLPDQGVVFDDRSSKLRWFILPSEAQDLLLGNSQNVKQEVPFDPVAMSSRRSFIENQDIEMISISAPLSSNNSSPRHFSLSSLDDRPKDLLMNTLPQFNYDFQQNQCQNNNKNNVNFHIGEIVNSQNNRSQSNRNSDNLLLRERCYSLNSVSPMLSPQTRASLGMHTRPRHCSCSSQTDLQSYDSESNLSPTNSLCIIPGGSISDCSLISRSPYLSQDTDDLQAYVQEVTKELATTIKSEIRGVINKVEDVLENTENLDSLNYGNSERHGSGSEDGRSDSISVNEVAEYIVEVSKNMADQVKSEIRDVVSAVDVFIAPDGPEKSIYSRASSSCSENDKLTGAIPKRLSPMGKRLSVDSTIYPILKTSSGTKLNEIDQHLSLDDSKSKKLFPMIGSISSQDSGINLSFHEPDFISSEEKEQRSNSESSVCRKKKSKSETKDENHVKWHSVPKNIWSSSLEALQEFKMIENDDRVLVYLSGSHDSLCLLHVLHQYQNAQRDKGIHFEMAAALINSRNSQAQPYPLVNYLENLGVPFVCDDIKKDGDKKQGEQFSSIKNRLKCGQLYSLAKDSGYNVLAIPQHLDDLAEDFLLSLFHGGRLQAMKAKYSVKEYNLKIIRPFIYVREKNLRQFSENRNLPVVIESCIVDSPKERYRTKQLLAQQEILFPNLFWSLRTAIQPYITNSTTKTITKNSTSNCEENSISICIESDTDEETVFFEKKI